MKKIAIILSGCGHKDGSEITEAVSLIIALSQLNAKLSFFAPNIDVPAYHNNNEARNAIIESSRISRIEVIDIKNLDEKKFDAIAFPGGYGAAKVLSNWASKGAKAEVLPEIKNTIQAFHQNSKPIAAICIAPNLVACVLGKHNIELTIGNDPETIKEIEKTGARHVDCPVDDFITDRENKIITTPAYMYDNAKPHEIFNGISKLAKELIEMA